MNKLGLIKILAEKLISKKEFLQQVPIIILLLAAASIPAHAQKVKNVSGTIEVSGTTYPIDSVIHSYRDADKKELFYVYYTVSGSWQLQLFQLPYFSLGGSVPWDGGSFASNDKHDGNGGVLLTFANSDGSLKGSISYSRYMPHLVRATGRDSAETSLTALTSIVNPPDYSNKLAIPFHLWMDGKIDDNDPVLSKNLAIKRVLRDANGKQVDSVQYVYDNTTDTLDFIIYVKKSGKYTKTISFIADTFVFVPDTIMNLRYIINLGIYQSQCKGLPWLAFDASYTNVDDMVQSPTQEGTGWRDGGAIGVIQDSGTIFINNILRFHGIMKIDTINSLVDANGEFYVFTALPLTGNAGPWKIGAANWPKFSYSCNGIAPLLPLINESIQSDAIAGFKFRIDSIYFFTDANGISGVRLGARVRIPNVTYQSNCGSFGSSTSPDISIAPIEITSNSIGGALHVSNLSVYPFFCVKDLFGSYYSKPDSLNFGAEIKTPFVDKLALGAGWKQGVWDAVNFNVQQATGGIPIGNTTMLLSGVRGSASGWNNPPLQCSIGGTFDNVTPNFMRWEGDVSYKEPSTLKGSLTLKFINVIDWQVVMNATAEIDWDHYVKFSGSLQGGTLGNGYVFNGNADLTFTWSPTVDLIGSGKGSYSIPKLFKNNLSAITDYINSLLPIQIASADMSLKSGVMRGNISLPTIVGAFSGHLTVNLNLPPLDPNFINFGRGTIPINSAHFTGKNQIASLLLDSIHVPLNTELAVICIRSNGVPSSSSLIDPSNIVHSNKPSDSLIRYTTDAATNHGFWVLKQPTAGTWKLSMPLRSSSDTIDAAAQLIEEPLKFTAIQTSKHVVINWTPISTGDSADVTAYLADSSSGYRGFLIAIANDKDRTLSFDLKDSLPSCQYYLYAARDNGAYISQSYSSLTLDNSKTSALAPTNATLIHLGGDSILIRWSPPTSSEMLAYAIRVTDAKGVDSIYRSASANNDSVVIVVQNPQGKRISLDAYGNGIQSCWSPSISAVSSVPTTNNNQVLNSTLGLKVWPNPGSGKCELSFTLAERNMVRVTIFDILGREITTPVQAVLDAGMHTSTCDLSSLSPGTYYSRIQSAGTVETVKLVIER